MDRGRSGHALGSWGMCLVSAIRPVSKKHAIDKYRPIDVMGDLSIASGTYWVKVVLHLPYMACLVMTSHLAFHMAKIARSD
jgi:hypothetical protein